VLCFVPGSERPERFIVVTAHFDHLGTRNGQVYPGADDNASGTAGLIEIARQIAASPPRNSILFAALDAEEIGLRGARALVADPPVPLTAISLNVNLDMIGRSDVDELYAAGTHHYPSLTDLVERVAGRADIRLLRGHDRPDLGPRNDWTMLSDHAAFHEVGIPFIYFGVEDHDDYHSPTDTFENIQLGFFVQAVRTVLDFVREADAWLDEVDSVRAVDR
jgi:Zn-dependent M28 family amino/carboxypeptidase